MKRNRSDADSETGTPEPTRHRRRKSRSSKAPVMICPDDGEGPRIPKLFLEFEENSPISAHMEWLHHLELSCEKQGCYVSGCATGSKKRGRRSSSFARAHGAKTLINGMNMFLTYHIPRYYRVSSDEDWRKALAALRSFHAFCVRRRYVKEDAVLMLALHRLRGFRIHTIPVRIQKLIEDKYWDSIEDVSGSEPEESPGDQSDKKTEEKRYASYVGGEMAVTLDEVLQNGWVLRGEDHLGEETTAFVSLPADLAGFGMKGMSVSCMALGLRNGIWRPIRGEGDLATATVYPPDDVFFY